MPAPSPASAIARSSERRLKKLLRDTEEIVTEEISSLRRLVDAFRTLEQEPEQYTWWSNRGAAWDKNVGWRIDYHVVTPGLRDKVQRTEIYKAQRFSDHAPLIMDYDWAHDG